MNIARFLAVMLGSSWLLPVSFASSLFAWTRAISEYDARSISAGDAPNVFFPVLVENDGVVASKPLVDLDRYLTGHPSATTLLSATAGVYQQDEFGESRWRVIETVPQGRRIEVREAGDDYTIVVRYLATGRGVTPEHSRLTTPGHMMAAIPFAIGFAFLVRYGGRRLSRSQRITR